MEADVQEVIEFFEWTEIADKPFELFPNGDILVPPHWQTPLTLRKALINHLDIFGRPKRYFFHLLSFFTPDVMHAEKLQEFASAQGQEELYAYCHKLRRTTFEVLTDFHSCKNKIPVGYLFDLVPAMRPKMYSISSTQNNLAGRLDVTVGVVKYKTRMQKMREGVCSKMIAALGVGDTVHFRIDHGTMKLPKDLFTPVILIGAGTGIAPMRSLLLERIHQGATENVLFTGFRGKSSDNLYGSEFEAFEKSGQLTVFNAFSRDDPNKVVYIQHRMVEQGQLIWDLLKRGACLYVSGNAQRIPKGVNDALVSIFKKTGGLSEEEALAHLAGLEKSRQYQSECW
ncbi:UNVERIFIED_CONTAM: NADPH-dependent diflavin oxidoreductase 1, partial [Siphonaria sp. JEL0065]